MTGCLLFLLLALPLSASAGKATEKRDGIYYLQKDDFDSTLGDKNFAVYFHSPWSDQSSKVLFEFESAAKTLILEELNMSFGVVDLSEDEYDGYRFGASQGPAIKIFHNAKPYALEGNFTSVGIVEGVRSHAAADWTPSSSGETLIELDGEAALDAHIKKEKLTLVEFYAPWCNHCQQLEPIMNDIADRLSKNEPPIAVAKMDAEKHGTVFDRYKMKGYPTVLLFKNGQHIPYEGVKATEQMVDFVKSRMGKSSTDVPAKVGAVGAFSDSMKMPAVVGFFPSRSAFEFTQFMEVAESFQEEKDISFGHVVGPDALVIAKEEFGIDSEEYGVVVVRDRRLPNRKGASRFSTFSEDPMEKDGLKAFIREQRLSLVGYASTELHMRNFYGKLSPLAIVFMDIDWDQDTRETMNFRLKKVTSVAERFPDVHFLIADHQEMHSLRDHLGLLDNEYDMAAALFINHTRRYPLDGECTTETLTEHVETLQKGEQHLQPYYRTQKVPRSDTGPVKTLVRATFDAAMQDTVHDIAVLFMAPWSQESKKFLPILKKAHGVLNAPSVLFYKYDTSLNDLPEGIEVETHPSLRLFKAGDSRSTNGLTYSGPRNSKSIADYLRSNAATLAETEEEEEQSEQATENAEDHTEL